MHKNALQYRAPFPRNRPKNYLGIAPPQPRTI